MTTQTLERTFSALADPTRLEIVGRLGDGPASVTALAAPFDLSLRAVLKHVSVLEDAGLVRTRKTGRVRTCELAPERLHDATRWMEQVRARWERRVDRIERYASERGAR